MGLQQVSPNDKHPAMRQLGVRHLQLGPLAADRGPILAPVELEGFTRREDQRHEDASSDGLLLNLPPHLPAADKRRNPAIGSLKTQRREISVHLLGRALLLARFGPLLPQPARQLLGKRIQLAGPVRNLKLRLHRVRPQIFADRVPRQPRTPLNLTDRNLLPKMPTTNWPEVTNGPDL